MAAARRWAPSGAAPLAELTAPLVPSLFCLPSSSPSAFPWAGPLAEASVAPLAKLLLTRRFAPRASRRAFGARLLRRFCLLRDRLWRTLWRGRLWRGCFWRLGNFHLFPSGEFFNYQRERN